MLEQKILIGGEWIKSDDKLAIKNPYSNSIIAEQHQANAQQVENAILAAHQGYAHTSEYSSYERSEILQSVASQIRARKEEFAQTICSESGKPIVLARSEVDRAITTFQIASEETKRISGEVIPLDVSATTKGRTGIVNHFPIGIILCITPFNFPLNLVAHKLAPAIATGNSFILKPAPQTPLTSYLLGEVLLNSGFEKKAINIVSTTNALAEKLVEDQRIAMLSFTGSANVGWSLKSKAGKKKVVLELGGNAGVIVDQTADISHAVARCVLGGFAYAGQICIKVQRIFVHESVYEPFIVQLQRATEKVIMGNPADEHTLVGPVINEGEAKRIETWVNESIDEGAALIIGGVRNGKFYQPTLLTNVSATMKVCSEEIFGPVITVEKYSTPQESVEKVNETRYGLQVGIFTNDFSFIQYCYQHLHVGGVIVNDYPTFRVDNMPYGGIKDSGFGREGVRYAMEEMLEKKLLVY